MAEDERGSFNLDRELRLTGASANTLAIWGMAAPDVVGRKLVEVFPYVDGNEVHKALVAALDAPDTQRLRAYSVALDKPVEVEIHPVMEGLQVSFSAIRV